MSTTMPDERPVALLGAPSTRRFLNDFVKRRVGSSDADDVVQTILCDALQAARIPDTETEMRRWLTGIARHKIADLHRKAGREQPTELPDIETAPAPVEERMMAEWAEEQAPKTGDAARTLRWMAREGEGEKLEQIAAEEKVEAATVRQRVSRMRRWMKERWVAELAAVAIIATLGFLVWKWLKTETPEAVREPSPSATPEQSPIDRAVALRRGALEACKRAQYHDCIEGLDRARDLDPAGDSAPEIGKARDAARNALDNQKEAPQKSLDNNLGPDQKNQGPVQKPVDAPSDVPLKQAPTNAKPSPTDTQSTPKAPSQTNGTPSKTPSKPKAPTPDSFGKKSSRLDGSKDSELDIDQTNAPPASPPQPTPQQAFTSPASIPSFFPSQASDAPAQSMAQSPLLQSTPMGTGSLGPKTKRASKK